MTIKIVMIAGEASGDSLGGQVLAALNARRDDLEVTGVGGDAMQAHGLKPIFPMADLTVMGFSHAIKSYGSLKKRAAEIIDHIFKTRPDVIVTIDNKGFSLRLGKALKAKMAATGWSAPIVHLVAPTVWAWGAWRAKSVAASVDKLLCLFPFELPYFTRYGVDAVAVGHPAVEQSRPSKFEARKVLGLKADDHVLVLLPGSRKREIEALLPDMLQSLSIIRRTKPNLKVFLPAASSVRPLITGMVTPEDQVEVTDQSDANTVMAAGDYGLICSGTVTLEAALSGLDGHVYYQVDGLSLLIGKMILDWSKVVLPNAISGQEIYPLSLNKEFTAKTMAADALAYFAAVKNAAEEKSDSIKTPLTKALTAGDDGFAENTANAIMSAIKA